MAKRVKPEPSEPTEEPPPLTPVQPSADDEVHYNGGVGHCLSAVVVATYGGYEIALDVTDDEGQVSDRRGVSYGDVPGTWHWPE